MKNKNNENNEKTFQIIIHQVNNNDSVLNILTVTSRVTALILDLSKLDFFSRQSLMHDLRLAFNYYGFSLSYLSNKIYICSSGQCKVTYNDKQKKIIPFPRRSM